MKKAPELWDQRIPPPGQMWQHACHPNIWNCVANDLGEILVSSLDGTETFTVYGYDTLCLPNMGRD